MVARVRVGHGLAPQRWRKDDDGKQEKDAGDFEQKDPADTAKRAEEAADTLTNAALRLGCGLPDGLAGRPNLGRGAEHRAVHGIIGSRRPWRQGAAGWLWLRRQALPGDAPGNANADAQSAADATRSHTDYDGSSGMRRGVAQGAAPGFALEGEWQ